MARAGPYTTALRKARKLGVHGSGGRSCASVPVEASRGAAGSGIYKMASSLGAAFGVAASAAIFTALSESGLEVVGNMIDFIGRQDNVAVREAGMVGLAFNALMALAALISITIFIPKQEKA